jgi:hypothetical protein
MNPTSQRDDMTSTLLRYSGATLLLLSTVSSFAAQTSPSMNAEQGWSAIGRCASISNERARHGCLDDVLRNAGLLTPQVEATERRRQFGLDGDSTRAPREADAVPPPSPPPPSRSETVERLEAAIATIDKGADGKVVITTTDGALWKQTDADTIPRLPAAGDLVKIRKATFGSFLCELPSHHTFRCVRSK